MNGTQTMMSAAKGGDSNDGVDSLGTGSVSQNIQTRLTGYFLLILAAGHHQPVCGGTVPGYSV